MNERHTKPKERVTLFDRLAMAFAGAVVGALTLAGYVVVFGFLRVGPRPGFVFTFWQVSVTFIAICAIAGALLDPERLASFFSALWGTNEAWNQGWQKSPPWLKLAVLLLALLVIGGIFYNRPPHNAP